MNPKQLDINLRTNVSQKPSHNHTMPERLKRMFGVPATKIVPHLINRPFALTGILPIARYRQPKTAKKFLIHTHIHR